MSDSRLLEVDPNTQFPETECDTELAPVESPVEVGDPQSVDGPVCEKCGAAMGNSAVSFCRSCGYYPSMGTYVEIDTWEKTDTGQACDELTGRSHIQIWIELLPAWVWKLIGCHSAVVAISIAVRLLSSAEGTFRMAWSVSQLFIGFLVFLACHLLAYFAAIEDDAEFSLIDFVLRPFKVWAPTIKKLPKSFSQVASGTCGFNAALMSIIIVGGLPYHVLWDWGIKEPPKKSLISAIVAQAKQAKGDADDLEDAIGDFAGTTDGAMGALEAREALDELRLPVDCVIVGYTTSLDGDQLAALILAREFEGKLVLVGRVSTGLEDETRTTYFEKLKEIGRPTPFVKTSVNANWVDPVYTCRVTCRSKLPTGRLIDMKYDQMLGSIE